MKKLRKQCDETKLIHNRIRKDKRSVIAVKSKIKKKKVFQYQAKNALGIKEMFGK